MPMIKWILYLNNHLNVISVIYMHLIGSKPKHQCTNCYNDQFRITVSFLSLTACAPNFNCTWLVPTLEYMFRGEILDLLY